MKLSASYGLTSSLARKNGSDKKMKVLTKDLMSGGSRKLEGGEFSLHLNLPRRCPGFALALIDNVFLQQYNPPFCFPSSYSCTLC